MAMATDRLEESRVPAIDAGVKFLWKWLEKKVKTNGVCW